jgi:hypothetical protein
MIQRNSLSLFSETMSQVSSESTMNPIAQTLHAIELRYERAMVQFS